MAVSFDTTIGGANSTSYVSVSDADDYWSTRLYSTAWDAASNTEKENSLIFATRLLDAWVDWKGVRSTEDQALRWPRWDVYDRDEYLLDSDIIPTEIANATAELAGTLLSEDTTSQPDTLGFSRLKVDVLEMDIDKIDRDKYGALPDSVISMVEAYGFVRSRAGGAIKVIRT